MTLVGEAPMGGFAVGDRSYHDIGGTDMGGVYDWLRAPSGRLLGVRFWPLLDFEFPVHLVGHLDYVVRDDKSLDVYFAADRQVDPNRSNDQDFGDNMIFAAEEGELVITFGTRWLSDEDLASLRNCPVEWLPVHYRLGGGEDPSDGGNGT